MIKSNMLTTMTLKGSGLDLAGYYYKEDNYYYDQAANFKEIASGDPQAGAVQIYGNLCGDLNVQQGQSLMLPQFYNLLNSCNPAGDKIRRKTKVKGVDLTFSASKSISILALVLKDGRIIKAHDAAVLEVMKEIEKDFAFGRPDSLQAEKTGKLAYTTVMDGFNREHEPHLHTHICLMNMTRLVDGRFTALDMKAFLKRDFNKLYGALYRAKLNAKLKDLGYSMTYEKGGFARLDKVSHELEMAFSQRREQIKANKKDGMKDMEAWDKNRRKKPEVLNKAEVLADWQQTAEQTVKKSEQLNKEDTIRLRDEWKDEAIYAMEAQQEKSGLRENATESEMWKMAALRAAEKTAVFSKDKLFTEYLKETERQELGITTIEELETRLKKQIALQHILTVEPGNPDSRFTINEVVKAERNIINAAKDWGRQFDKPKMESHILKFNARQKAAPGGYELSENQKEVLSMLLKSGHRYDALQGDAGTGKTTILRAYKYALDKENIKVYGLAAAGAAAKTLQGESGIESRTVAAYLFSPEKPKNAVIVIDEASLIGSINMDKLIRNAQANNNKILFVGDKNQLASIEAGNAFGRIVEELKKSGRLAHLKDLHRQRNVVLKEAADHARNGKMKESLAVLEKNDKVKEIEKDKDRIKEIAGQYNKETLIVTTTRQSKMELDGQIRENLTAAGRLSDPKTLQRQYQTEEGITETDEIEISKGEHITFTKNEYKDYDIRNGERATVKAINGDTMAVQTEDGRNIDIDIKRYAYMDYGYSMTTYKAQGQTYNKVIVNADTTSPSLADMRNQYVMTTRARDDVKVYTDDKERLKDLAGMRTHKTDTLDMNISREKCDRREQEYKEHIRAEKRGERIEILTPQEEGKRRRQRMIKANAELNKKRAMAARAATARELPPLPKQEPQKEIKIHSEKVIKKYGHGIPDMEKAVRERQAAATKYLNEDNIPKEDKERIAQLLNDDKNIEMWRFAKAKPESTINAAKIKLKLKTKEEVLNQIKDITEKSYVRRMAAEETTRHLGLSR